MKTILAKMLIMSLFFAVHVVRAETGTEGGNGGDWVAIEFKKRSGEILEFIRRPGNNIHNLDLSRMQTLLKDTVVKVSSEPLKDKHGREVDALNFFPKRNEIILYRKRWVEYFLSPKSTHGLVYHEWLPAFALDDTDEYKLSGELSQRMHGTGGAATGNLEQLAQSLQMQMSVTRNYARGESRPESDMALCYQLGELVSETRVFSEALIRGIRAMPKPPVKAFQSVQHFADSVAGTISFCQEGYVAVPEAVDGSEESFRVNYRDRAHLRQRLEAAQKWLDAFLKL